MGVANHEGSKILFSSSYAGVSSTDLENKNIDGGHANVIGQDIPDIAYQSVTVTSRTNTQPIAAIGYRGVPAISDLVGSVEVALEGILCNTSGVYASQAVPAVASGFLGRTLYDFVSQWGGIIIQTKGGDTDAGGAQTDKGRAACCYGMFLNSVSYSFQQNTNVTTTWNFVGYNCIWDDLLETTVEPAIGTGINLVPLTSKDIAIEVSYAGTLIPVDGVQSVTFNASLNREEVFQLGTKGPFERPVKFPFEVTAAIEVLADYADLVNNVTPTYEWNNPSAPNSPNAIKIFVYKKNAAGAKIAKICGAPYQRPVDGGLRLAVGANSTVSMNTTGWEFQL